MKVSHARLAAFQVLRRVEEDGAFASVLLAASVEEMRADDRALCYELVLGVLRWQLWLDRLIEHYARRGAETLDAPVRQALRLGLYQLRFLERVPQSAAVNESVNLAKHARLSSAASFINAVLRRATREPDYDPAANIVDPLERLAVETSHPAHLLERWANHFGIEDARAFARANNDAPPVAFRLTMKSIGVQKSVNSKMDEPDKGLLHQLRAAGGELQPSSIVPDAWRVAGAGGLVRELAREGRIYIQDEASQLIAHVLDAQAGERVLDVCAAPGGKTTHVALNTNDEAQIFAGDVREQRLRTLLEACARQDVKSVRVAVFDAIAALPFPEGSFDRVLVDAPCSGTGTLRRNPEIRWRIKKNDIAELAQRQQRILARAAPVVRPGGGRLLYSTCSIEPEENESVVKSFLADHHSFKQLAVNVPASLLTSQGAARTWPQRDGTDGFFIALLERSI
ncbi:MAG: 16S rRNA (cytosine(967)-C(5))-methyltransferase RsmB [Pyrinomonadaceae bacterium]